jgi:phage-related tail fiber protein
VAWANSPAVDASVRLGLGTWTPAVVSSSFSQLTNLVAGNNAFASTTWTTGIHVKYHVALVESDYR